MGLERVFVASWTLRKLRSAPLGVLLDDFCEWLWKRGFGRHSIRSHLGNVSHLNAWLGERGRQWSGCLSRKDIEGFWRAYPSRSRNRVPLEEHLKPIRHSVNRFVEFLREKGHFDLAASTPLYCPLLEEYLAWMRDRQHASDGTLEVRRGSIKRFLEALDTEATPEGLSKLTADDVETFFVERARTMGHAARRSLQAALRTFLRFCLHQAYIQQRLDRAVPTLRTYKLAGVPRALRETQAQVVLESVDRSTTVGRRDYAILRLLYTYGVRGGQVRLLQLNDVRWTEDQILFRAAKKGKDCLLPLTAEVGESLLDYLQHGRPRCSFPQVFLTCRAPYRPLPASSSLSQIVRRCICAAGVDLPSRGAHVFRHAFATRMVAEGHPFKAVADMLGHRHLSTTFIYTKVDFNALSQVALPWPEEVVS